MKKAAIVFILIIHYSPGVWSQTANPNGYNKFFYENGKLSSEGLMKDGKPDGYWKNYYKSGKLKITGNRKNFLLDSIWKFYDEKGRISKTINYQEGKKNGITIVYDTLGHKLHSEEYKNDVLDGYTKAYFKNGKVKTVTHFIKGLKEGRSLEFTQDSTITGISIFKGGALQSYEKINQRDGENKKQGIWKEFYTNDEVKKEMRFNDDSLDGYVKEFDQKGNLLSTKKFNNGKQVMKAPEIAQVEVYREVFEDGTLKYEGVYSDGVAIGTHFKYRKKWQCDSSIFLRSDTERVAVYIKRLVCRNEPVPDSAIEYFDGVVIARGAVDSARNRIKLWYEYHNTGEFKGKGIYKNGNRTGDWEFFYASGKLEQKGRYDSKGREQGPWKWFYENGNLLREENYVNGKREGLLTDYDESGKVILKGNFTEDKKEGKWIYETDDYKESGNYAADQPDSVWVSYYLPSKIKRFEGRFRQGEPEGIHKLYREDGKRLYVGNYVGGMKDGDWKFYDEHDFNYLTITYKNDIEVKWQGERIHPTYDESLRTYNIKLDGNRTQTIKRKP